MSSWKQKRFWTAAAVAPHPEGFTVHLDGRQVKTPAKADLVVPTEEMAQAIAAEWDAQEGEVRPAEMPVTRGANAAIDKVRVQHDEVADMLAAYGDADLLCYRAAEPEELVRRQSEAWDPMLDWAAEALGARLEVRTGVIHAPQPQPALDRLAERVQAMTAFQLAAFHDLVSLSGSLVLAFAAVHRLQPVERLWEMSRIDETWQEELWGVDEEARALAERKRQDFLLAARFFDMS